MKLEKDGIIKDIINEPEIKDYISAGWKPFTAKRRIAEEMPKSEKNLFKKREDR